MAIEVDDIHVDEGQALPDLLRTVWKPWVYRMNWSQSALYAASDDQSFVNGPRLHVDGGMSLAWPTRPDFCTRHRAESAF